TLSCGVIEVARGESSTQLVQRAHDALRFAKRAGRNRCALDEGKGPTMLDPPQFPVKNRVISLSDEKVGTDAAPATSPPADAAPHDSPAETPDHNPQPQSS